MADNTVLNVGSGGDIIATDQDTLGVKHQKVKVEFGSTDNFFDVDNTLGNRLPVALGDGSVEYTLNLILIELRVITEFLKQGLNVKDDADLYRTDAIFTNNI